MAVVLVKSHFFFIGNWTSLSGSGLIEDNVSSIFLLSWSYRVSKLMTFIIILIGKFEKWETMYRNKLPKKSDLSPVSC